MSMYSFDAEPKIIHSKSKYNKGEANTSRNLGNPSDTFVSLMQDNRIKLLDPVQQEKEYIRMEKERIKLNNMHNQLLYFKKGKKRMTPYDIKPSPNPKIEINLEFFLSDATNIPPEKITIDTQTDQFQNKPPSPKYVPKKTGIDVGTQVFNCIFSLKLKIN